MYIVDKCERWPNYIAISEIYISKTLLQSLARCNDKRPYHSMESQKVFVLDDQVAYKLNIDVSKSKNVCTIGKPYARLLHLTGDQAFLPAKTIHDAFFGIQNNINDKSSIQISNHKIKACTLTIFTISPQLRLRPSRSSFSKR